MVEGLKLCRLRRSNDLLELKEDLVSRKKSKAQGANDPEVAAIPASLKKFRQSPEIEGFYRFIYENDLRTEAFEIIDDISQKRLASKTKKKSAK
jgi:hypothetical protein